ncbi:MAG: TonB-dependent receptor [Deltaproteobacteria bacterium]|nr:TonB-dependent receptor [Deltaproteobacteria bacterium]
MLLAKIVVIKGAASVPYGANTEASIINIITKAPFERPVASGWKMATGYDPFEGYMEVFSLPACLARAPVPSLKIDVDNVRQLTYILYE